MDIVIYVDKTTIPDQTDRCAGPSVSRINGYCNICRQTDNVQIRLVGAQANQGLLCLLQESMDIVVYVDD